MKNKLTATLPLALLAIGMLGSVTSANAADLNNSIYVALDAPCRVGDTHGTTTPTIPAGGTVEWHAYGITMSDQGGDPDGCLQPKTGMNPIGIAVNITAAANNVATTRNGNLVAYAANATAPTTSVVNYTPGTNIANSTIVGLNQDGKFIIQSNLASVRAIADVQGYFYARPSGVAQVAVRGGDYSSPVDAMTHVADWCGTPSTDNRCLMMIAPGTYDIGSAQIVMQEWVSIQGSGLQVTTITTVRGSGDKNESSSAIVGASNTTLSDLSVFNASSSVNDVATGIYLSGVRSSNIERVQFLVSGDSNHKYAMICVELCHPLISNADFITISGGKANNAAFILKSSPNIRQSNFFAGGSDSNIGVFLAISGALIKNSTLTVGGAGDNKALSTGGFIEGGVAYSEIVGEVNASPSNCLGNYTRNLGRVNCTKSK